jgi:hypothetical protein
MKDPGRRDITKAYRRPGGLATLAAVVAVGLAACGGTSTPHVASLSNRGGNSAASTTTTLPRGNPTQLLDEWAACERTHGDPGQADPTIDTDKVIHIAYPAGYNPGPVKLGAGSSDPCGSYLSAASSALRGGQTAPKATSAQLENFAKCMRANGVPDFPDPTNNGFQIQANGNSDLNPNNPTFENAQKVCAHKVGVPALSGSGSAPAGAIQATAGSGPQGGPGGNGGSGAGFGSSSGQVSGG